MRGDECPRPPDQAVTAGTPALVPSWLERAAAVGWRALAIIGVGLVGVAIALAVPVSATAVMVSLVLAATLAPTVVRLRARGLPPSAAAAIAFGIGAVLVVGTLLIVAVALVPDLRAIARAVETGLQAVHERLTGMGVPEAVSAILDALAASVRGAVAVDPGEIAGSLVDLGMLLVLGTFLTYFLLADGDQGWAVLMRRLQPWQARAVTADAEAGLERVAWYVRRTALLALVDAGVTFLVLLAFGAPLPAALAAVSLAAGFVPYLGAVVGGATVALATLALAGSTPALTVIAALAIAGLLANRLLERTSMDSRADVNPVIVLLAIPAGFAMLGLLGVLALLPLTVFGLAVSRAIVTALGMAPADGTPAPDADPGPAAVPLWLDRLAQWSWRGLVLAGIGWLVVLTVDRVPVLVAPVSLAIVAAATMLPVVGALERRGMRRGLAAGASMVVVVAVAVVACVVATAVAVGSLGEILDAATAGPDRWNLGWLRDGIASIAAGVRVDVAAILANSVGLVLDLVLALLVCFFLLRDGPAWWRRLLDRLAPGRRAPVGTAGHRAAEVLGSYVGGTAVISLFGAITSGLIMVVLGLPLALPVVVIGFFFGFIPYLGSFLTTAIAVLVTLALGTPFDMAVMLVFTVVFNIVQGNIVTPIVYGRGLALHPAVVLMAIPVGGELAGMLGMFLVVPVAAVIAATGGLVTSAIDGGGPPQDD